MAGNDRDDRSERGGSVRVAEVLSPLPNEKSNQLLIRTAVQAIRENPQDAEAITESAIRLFAAQDVEYFAAYADAQRRREGMRIGAGLSVLFVAGGIAVALTGGAAAVALALIAAGAASAGGTFAVITGTKVEPKDFASMLNSARGHHAKNDESSDSR